jgi:hypothetical protein
VSFHLEAGPNAFLGGGKKIFKMKAVRLSELIGKTMKIKLMLPLLMHVG